MIFTFFLFLWFDFYLFRFEILSNVGQFALFFISFSINKKRQNAVCICVLALGVRGTQVLFYELHFLYQMAGAGKFVDNEKYVTNIDVDGALQVVVKENVARHGF